MPIRTRDEGGREKESVNTIETGDLEKQKGKEDPGLDGMY